MTQVADSSVLFELPVDFTFTDSERDQLQRTLLGVTPNPYRDYHGFAQDIYALAKSSEIPERFAAFCVEQISSDRVLDPFLCMRNCPVDPDPLPVWDFRDPVNDKRKRKSTFVAEGFLQLYATLMDQPVLTYINVNDGDRFQDIYPKEDMASTQSQKALHSLWFHKDLANHFVRPDYVNMLGMRGFEENTVYTTFVRNVDLLQKLDADTIAVLRQKEFYTPFDDLSTKNSNVELGRADDHVILSGNYDIRYFENRTEGLTDRAKHAITKLNQTLHELKLRVHVMQGDFVSIYNNYAVHAKEVHTVADEDELRKRWIIKTVNVDDLAAHDSHYIDGDYGVVNG